MAMASSLSSKPLFLSPHTHNRNLHTYGAAAANSNGAAAAAAVRTKSHKRMIISNSLLNENDDANANDDGEYSKRTSTCTSISTRRRRDVVVGIAITCSSITAAALLLSSNLFGATAFAASQFTDMPALKGKDYGKTKMNYPDYVQTPSGLQYKDLRQGAGPTPNMGDTVVVDWDGYTIGYYGRIFEARNKTKGGSFEGEDKLFFKFVLGSHQVIPAFEEAIVGMAPGGVRRIIVPPELGYPDNDYNKGAPKPATFSGQRALDFVLKNQGLIDKTLLFDIELIKIIPS